MTEQKLKPWLVLWWLPWVNEWVGMKARVSRSFVLTCVVGAAARQRHLGLHLRAHADDGAAVADAAAHAPVQDGAGPRGGVAAAGGGGPFTEGAGAFSQHDRLFLTRLSSCSTVATF